MPRRPPLAATAPAALAVAAALLTSHCVQSDKITVTPTPTASDIALVSGDGQSGVITLALQDSLVVLVTQAGVPVSGFPVNWAVTTAQSGSVPGTTLSGSDGRARARWILGTAAGAVSATAGNPALTGTVTSVTFNATAIGASIAIQSGDDQAAAAGQRLDSALVVILIDANGDSIAGKTVTWNVTEGGGSVSPHNSISLANGSASTDFTLGSTSSLQRVTATAAGFTGSPVTFRATAQLPPLGATVAVRDNFYDANDVTIQAGERVDWTWAGFNEHTVTFDTPPSSGRQSSGVFSRVFTATGVFTYFCTVHGAGVMLGRVTVIP